MIKHPETYISNSYRKKYIPFEQLHKYTISNIIDIWSKYFISLGIKLKKSEEFIPYEVMVKYNGNGFYEIRFILDYKIENNKIIYKQTIPYHIQLEIEKIILEKEYNFIDCDSNIGEIYVSFNFDEHHFKYTRKAMINNLLDKINLDN